MKIRFWFGIGFGALTVRRYGGKKGLYFVLPFVRIHILEYEKDVSVWRSLSANIRKWVIPG